MKKKNINYLNNFITAFLFLLKLLKTNSFSTKNIFILAGNV